jgi:hypothetical protein
MTSVLSCVLATIALAADPGLRGLPLGIPPAPEDAVISHVAPPQCLLYVNWAGTAAPNPASRSETEKLLAEPEVQDFLNDLNKVFIAYLRKTDEDSKKLAAMVQTTPQPPPEALPQSSAQATNPAGTVPPAPATPSASAPTKLVRSSPLSDHPSPEAVKAKPNFSISTEDCGDWLGIWLTHPTAVFVTDIKATPQMPVEKKEAKLPEAAVPEASPAPDMEVQGGMVVSLGSDAARLHTKFIKYLAKAKKLRADGGLEQIKIAGQTWYRSKPARPGDKNLVTFGFYGKYFVVGIGPGAVEGIVDRWNRPAPAWLTKALVDTQVPRRTGIIYINLKAMRDKLLPLASSKKDAVAALELLGLYNVESLVSTTGLEDYGMINRVLLSLDGKPRGLLDMVADRPLTAKDLEPIPQDALLAVAARVDLDRTLKVLIAAYEKAGMTNDFNPRKALDDFKKENGVDLQRLLASVGDSWCVYNSPSEGEFAFLGWTMVVPVRDRTTLVDGWEKLCAAAKAKEAKNKKDANNTDAATAADFRKCHFAGHEIYYLSGQAIAPAVSISDREMVMTLNLPAMKAYLARKNHRSLATLPGVQLALNDPNRPAALCYCDTPRLFDVFYPMASVCAIAISGAAQKANIDLEPTYWPSAVALRPHLRPDITTVERTPQGLQLTCRYCLPTGGANGPVMLVGLSLLASGARLPLSLPGIDSTSTSDSTGRTQGVIEMTPTTAPVARTNVVPATSGYSTPASQATTPMPGPYQAPPASGPTPSTYGYGTTPSYGAPSSPYGSSYRAPAAPNSKPAPAKSPQPK